MAVESLHEIVAARIAHRIRAIVVETTIPVRTGELRKSVHVTRKGNGKYSVGTNKVYARAVHDGRKAIVIRPKHKKALKWKGAAHPIKKVVQKKRKGNPFFKKAIKQFIGNSKQELQLVAPEIKNEVREALARSLKARGIKIK